MICDFGFGTGAEECWMCGSVWAWAENGWQDVTIQELTNWLFLLHLLASSRHCLTANCFVRGRCVFCCKAEKWSVVKRVKLPSFAFRPSGRSAAKTRLRVTGTKGTGLLQIFAKSTVLKNSQTPEPSYSILYFGRNGWCPGSSVRLLGSS